LYLYYSTHSATCQVLFWKIPVLFSRLSPTPLDVGVCAPCEVTGGRTGKHPME
jgi:hypothetical protein